MVYVNEEVMGANPDGYDDAGGQRSVSGVMRTQNGTIGVSIQCHFKGAAARTLQFNLQLLDNFSGAVNAAQAEAFIEFMVDGVTVTRRVSVANGTSITGMAQAIRAVVRDTSQAGAAGAGRQYLVSVTIADGTRSDSNVPPTLAPNPFGNPAVTTLTPGTGIDFTLPQDAGISSVQCTVVDAAATGAPVPDGAVTVSHFSGSGLLKVYDPRQIDWAVLAPGTVRVRVDNKSTTQTLLIQPTYGVDG